MFTGSVRFGLERADTSSPSPSPPSSLASVSFLFPPLEKENFVCFLPPSRPFPGRLFLSALLYCLKGFLLPGFPPNLVPVESGQNETQQSQNSFDVMKLGSVVVKDALPFPFCMNFFPFLGEKVFFDWVSILMSVWERKWDKSRKINMSHTHRWQIKVRKKEGKDGTPIFHKRLFGLKFVGYGECSIWSISLSYSSNPWVTAHAVTLGLYTTRGLAGTAILRCVLQSDDEIFYPSVTASTVYFAVIYRRSSTTAGDTNRLYELESRRLVLWLQLGGPILALETLTWAFSFRIKINRKPSFWDKNTVFSKPSPSLTFRTPEVDSCGF